MNFSDLVDQARAEIARPVVASVLLAAPTERVRAAMGTELLQRRDLLPVGEEVLIPLARVALALAPDPRTALCLVDNVLVFLRDDRPRLMPRTTPEEALLNSVGLLAADPDAMAEFPSGALPLLAPLVSSARDRIDHEREAATALVELLHVHPAPGGARVA